MPTPPTTQPRAVHQSNRGRDIIAYRRCLNAARDPKLGGPGWPRLLPGWIYGTGMEEAVEAFKRRHPQITETGIGPETYPFLARHADGFAAWLLLHTHVPTAVRWPLADPPHPLIGRPNQGTHDGHSPSGFANWESSNALDISCPTGTKVLAVIDGTIGSQIGPIDSDNPALAGSRVNLFGTTQDYYYAHLSRVDVHAGQHVTRGQQLGLSGSASGVQHLHFAQHHGDPGILIGSPSSGYHDENFPS